MIYIGKKVSHWKYQPFFYWNDKTEYTSNQSHSPIIKDDSDQQRNENVNIFPQNSNPPKFINN